MTPKSALTVDAWLARTGDGLSSYRDGIITAATTARPVAALVGATMRQATAEYGDCVEKRVISDSCEYD